jgi:class 3 adenylate cyclase/tRNA A-37 threonylcarbamoyl transferase component Bud32/tetratricopeptide (TPR) repeat protein
MIGKKLRAYEITEEIGAGGMATVFRAYQPSMDRHVAIKVIRSSILQDPGLRERFQREARLIARLEHPHLLPVYDFDGESDPPYIVMRYLDGGTLKQVQQRGSVPRDEVLHVLRQLAGALDYAHRQGIVHRDLKPSNIMIDREGNAFLTDFGIARSTGKDKDLTGTGLMIGTPGYMAPEQARGDGQVDKAADIYSLGVLAFESLAGSAPYEHESGFEVILAHMNSPIPKASERNPELPKAVDAVLARALAKKPADRFPSATEFVESITRALKIKPSGAPSALQSMTQTISVDQLAKLAASRGERETPGTGTPSEQQRQMTALAVDVKELAEILYETGADNERVRATVNALWISFGEIAKAAGGLIHSRTDDAGLILWGRERAREDDPENAIRAALAMRDRALEESRKVLGASWEPSEENPLPFVAGITTGPVLLERDGDSGSYTASGAPITLAARLKEAAPAGGILTAHETFTLVRGVFNFLQQDALRLRGRKDPIEVYLVTTAKPRAFRLRAMGIEGVETRMIGREIELRLLQEAMTLTLEDGETQVVTVVGEAGVGKSRLLYEFNNWIDLQEQVVWFFESRATQPSMLQPYSLARDLFSFRFRILDSDPLAQVREKFVQGVAGFMGEGSEKKAHYIGQLVGFDFTGVPEVAAALQDAEAFRRTAQGYLGELFTTASKKNPVMLLIEDIHWADDRSLDLINNLVRDNTELPLFVLCMARPSFYERRPQWGEGQRFHERIQLEPLSQLSSRRLVRELLKHVLEVPTTLRDLVVDRADGNPFYIEELIKALIDDRVIVKGEPHWSVDTTRLSTVRIPATLTGVLQARLDTLPPALYQLLQRASVIGRIFWDAAAIRLSHEPAGLEPAEVQAMLEELRDREMILQREESGFAGTVEYVFRHAILRDVTYETVIPRQRRALHKMVGDWLIEVGGERADEHTLLVAEHYGRAEEVSLAAAQLTKVGARAIRLATYEEAATILQRAREMLSSEHTEQRLGIDLLRGDIQGYRSSYGGAMEIYQPVLEEARAIGSLRVQAQVLGKMGRVAMWQSEFSQSVQYLKEAVDIARSLGDDSILMFNLRQMGNCLFEREPAESIRYLEESVEIARRLGDSSAEGAALNSLAIGFFIAGRHEASRDTYFRALELHRAAGDRLGEAMALGNLGGLYTDWGDFDSAERYCREAIAIAREIGAPALTLDTQNNQVLIHLRRGRDKEAHALLREVVRAAREVGFSPSIYALPHGIIRLRAGDRLRGLAWIGYARAHSHHSTEVKHMMRWFADLIRGNDSEEDVERALQAGVDLNLEEILAEAEREAP